MARSPEVTSRLLLSRAPWEAIDSEYEKRIPFDSPHESRDLLARLVIEGKATKHDLIRDGRKVGILVTRIEEGNLGRELVCISMYMDDGRPLSRELAEASESLARAEGCCTLRFHTVRPAMARLACEEYGYHITEIVCRRTLTA